MEQKKLTPKEFVGAYYKYAKQTEEKTGISAVFTLAQAALESIVFWHFIILIWRIIKESPRTMMRSQE